jgi:hypothetical protein
MKQSVFFLVMVALFLLSGCKDKGGAYKPNISGSTGEMLIVMDDSVRNGSGGKQLETLMGQPVTALPQVEPLFDVSVIPPRAFSERLKPFRNLVLVNIKPDNKPAVKFYKDRWGKMQAMARIFAADTWELDSIVKSEEERLTHFFVKAEMDRSRKYYRKYVNKPLTEEFEEKWNATMIIPVSYTENKPGKNFMWMSHETPLISQGLMVYSFDYYGPESISKSYLLNKRDSILQTNVPGSFENSYMATELMVPVSYEHFMHNDHHVVELRGLWKVEGDLMGGPFVCFAHIDEENNRIVVTDGYVYAPEKPEKRNLIWEVQSLLYSFNFLSNDNQQEDE